MTTTESWVHGRFADLTVAECRDLLTTATVGRVAFCTQDGPVVLPVNYVTTGEEIVFRTAPHNVIARHLHDRPAAFEVDSVDDFTQSGWSVLVRGRASYVEEVADLPESARPVVWPEGSRSLFIRIPFEELSGRRLYAT